MSNLEKFWNDQDVSAIYKKLEGKNLKVVLPEGEDDRSIDSLAFVRGITVVLLGERSIIEQKINSRHENSEEIMSVVEIIEPKDFAREDLAELFVAKRNGKLTIEDARKLVLLPNFFATLLLESGYVHALVGGSVYSTADILKPAFQIIKPAPGNSVVSSCFVMKRDDQKLVFADCAVNIEPTKDQLKEITTQTIETARQMGIDPKVAMLSYSTKGSGSGPAVDLVREAYEELVSEQPDLKDIIDGELQFDAAYVESTGKLKAPNSPVAGRANVFIFPNITAGNIAYKMVQQLGGYEAMGPLLQGLNKPVNDLSRGCDAVTIAKVMYLALRKY